MHCRQQLLCTLFLAISLAGVAVNAARGANVVADLSLCTRDNVLYSSEESPEIAVQSWYNETSAQANGTCLSALQNLTACSRDGNSSIPELNSLNISSGCCSTACATAVDEALIMTGPGCYRTFLEAVCNSTQNTSSLAAPLFGLVQRCIGVNASCAAPSAPGSLLPADLEARARNSTGHNSNSSTMSDVVNSLSPPDPFQLVPQGESGSPVVLATPEEIAQVLQQQAGGA